MSKLSTPLTGPDVPIDRGYLEFWQVDKEWLSFDDSDGNNLEMHITELANIPQVKALIEALENAKEQIRHDNESEAEYRAIDANLGVSEWESFMPVVWHKIDNALAPFKMSLGDKSNE